MTQEIKETIRLRQERDQIKFINANRLAVVRTYFYLSALYILCDAIMYVYIYIYSYIYRIFISIHKASLFHQKRGIVGGAEEKPAIPIRNKALPVPAPNDISFSSSKLSLERERPSPISDI